SPRGPRRLQAGRLGPAPAGPRRRDGHRETGLRREACVASQRGAGRRLRRAHAACGAFGSRQARARRTLRTGRRHGPAVRGRLVRRCDDRLRPAELRRSRCRSARVPPGAAPARAPGGARVPSAAPRAVRTPLLGLLREGVAAHRRRRFGEAKRLRVPAAFGQRLLPARGVGRSHGRRWLQQRKLPASDLRHLRHAPRARRGRTRSHEERLTMDENLAGAATPEATPTNPPALRSPGAWSPASAVPFGFEINTDGALLDPDWDGDVFEVHDRRYGLAISHFKSSVRGRSYDNDFVSLRVGSGGYYTQSKRFPLAFFGDTARAEVKIVDEAQARAVVWEAVAHYRSEEAQSLVCVYPS